MAKVLVTGASGFIGTHLVRRLFEDGDSVACFVRTSSNLSHVEPHQPRCLRGDVRDLDSVRAAVAGVDVVFHLAASSRALRSQQMWDVNETGAENVAVACADQPNPPVLIHVSSMAAAGPSRIGRPISETDIPHPVSYYGRSKLAGENTIRRFADRVPITIVRPPIVLGEADPDGLELFKCVSEWGVHVVPGFFEQVFSVIHVDDLVTALLLSAKRGSRANLQEKSSGIYFAAAESMTYAKLGQMIGIACGRRRTTVLRNAKTTIWVIAAINELLSQIEGKPRILNLDKAREATAGSWECSTDLITAELGFSPQFTFAKRLKQTADWYFDHGWLGGRTPSPRPIDSRPTKTTYSHEDVVRRTQEGLTSESETSLKR